MALVRRQPQADGLQHADRGVPSAAPAYQARLAAHGLTPSMNRTGDCYDNAGGESFFATQAWALIAGADWQTRAEARAAIFAYIEVWDNRQRRHAALGYVSPAAYEAQRRSTTRAA